jgi:NTE family protein
VEIGGREYVDGGVWSMSNLDAAPARRQAEVLALLPTFGRGAGRGAAGLLRAAGQAAGLAELQLLRARGARTRIVAPDTATIAEMGPDLMDAGPRREVYAAGRAQGRKLGG